MRPKHLTRNQKTPPTARPGEVKCESSCAARAGPLPPSLLPPKAFCYPPSALSAPLHYTTSWIPLPTLTGSVLFPVLLELPLDQPDQGKEVWRSGVTEQPHFGAMARADQWHPWDRRCQSHLLAFQPHSDGTSTSPPSACSCQPGKHCTSTCVTGSKAQQGCTAQAGRQHWHGSA